MYIKSNGLLCRYNNDNDVTNNERFFIWQLFKYYLSTYFSSFFPNIITLACTAKYHGSDDIKWVPNDVYEFHWHFQVFGDFF